MHIFKGDRVEIAPHSDAFAMGERFAEVTSVGRVWIHARGERSGRRFKFAKAGDSIKSTAPRVTINESQGVYVIRNSGGYSCLGFEVTNERARRYLDWLMSKGEPGAAGLLSDMGRMPNPSLERFGAYESALASIKARFDATGERCTVDLCEQLKGLEGKRVEIVDSYGERRRFIVGKSTGWIPVHLEIASRASDGGGPVYGAPFKSVQVIGS